MALKYIGKDKSALIVVDFFKGNQPSSITWQQLHLFLVFCGKAQCNQMVVKMTISEKYLVFHISYIDNLKF